MRAIFVLLYLPVLFSTTHPPKLLSLVKSDASSAVEATFCEDRVLRQCLTSCPALHTPVEPLNGEKALPHGRKIIPIPKSTKWNNYPYVFGSSQASSLLNHPPLNRNQLNYRHPLHSAVSFLHPIPVISNALLFASVAMLLVIWTILMLNLVWYVCWHCVKQINPILTRTFESKPLLLPSSNKNGTLANENSIEL